MIIVTTRGVTIPTRSSISREFPIHITSYLLKIVLDLPYEKKPLQFVAGQ
jgi:hypothetical protein